MKKNRLSLLLCTILLMASALAGCARSNLDIVVGQVGNETVTAREVELYANYMLMSGGYKRSDLKAEDVVSLNKSALDSVIQSKVLRQKAAALGLYPLTQDNLRQVDDQYIATMAQLESSYLSSYQQAAKTDPTIDAGARAKEAAETHLASYNLTESDLKTVLTHLLISDLLREKSTKDVSVSDEEVKTEYDRLLADQQSSYQAKPTDYDAALSVGSIIVYRPAGYRYIKHILISMPADIAAKISSASSSGDTATVASLRKQGLEQIKAQADEVLAKVQGGGDFDALIAQYGQDPGMKAEPSKSAGYQVGAKSNFVPEFLSAAMELKKPGDTSGLVATDYGYHILKYIGDVPAGVVPIDQVKESIHANLLTPKQGTAFEAIVKQWISEAKVKKNLAKLPVVTAPPAES